VFSKRTLGEEDRAGYALLMLRSPNSQLAVELYKDLQARYGWSATTAWQGIARLLLSCEVYRQGWEPFHNVVTYIDSNRFTAGKSGPHATLRRANQLTAYLAAQLDIARQDVCQDIGLYWRQGQIRNLQPHNLVGHALRSLIIAALQLFGDASITYEEWADRCSYFSERAFAARSRRTKIDIVARRGSRIVALLIARWRVRHNRLDVFNEALTYAPALQRHNVNGKIYAVLGEFDGGRLRRVLDNCPPQAPHAALSAAVHFAPELIREGLQENGTLEHLRSLDWLIGETFNWK
jgi:hypothetical protein